MEKSEQSVLRPLTSHDFRCGSKTPNNPSFFEAENDFVRRSSGMNSKFLFLFLEFSLDEEGSLNSDLITAAVVVVAEEVELRREEEEATAVGLADWSRVWSRSQRHNGQKPEKFSSG
ncbi:hypothetical protein HanRHA438_Chr16g0753051 [Helianthus annuus]|nr:hypothetical protein HanIR_Chr16g0805671 [Helianthus annuus]KAJ0835250.1 hypothetical protein HanRHA438_Chr16g0753051 [Helianthus annuus]